MEQFGLVGRVDKLEKDMYFGDGPKNPSMTTRMTVVEDSVRSISANLSKMVWLLVGIFLTSVGTEIVRLIHGH